MSAHHEPDHAPFTVVMCDSGATVVFQKLEDANRYMARQLADDRTSSVHDRHGQCVGANEIVGQFSRIFGTDGR